MNLVYIFRFATSVTVVIAFYIWKGDYDYVCCNWCRHLHLRCRLLITLHNYNTMKKYPCITDSVISMFLIVNSKYVWYQKLDCSCKLIYWIHFKWQYFKIFVVRNIRKCSIMKDVKFIKEVEFLPWEFCK